MNISSLNTLRAILVHGTFTAAGAAVGCTPSAVSLQVRQLEEFFGQPLFDRSTRVVRPTPFAREVAAAASDFSNRLDALRAKPTMVIEGRFRLGVITSMQSDLMPPALQLLRARHPGLDVRIPPLNDTDELLTELRAGRIEAALLVRPGAGGSTRMVWHDLHKQPYVMLAPPNATSTDPRRLLADHGWIGYDTSLPGGKIAARHVRALVPNIACSMELRSMDAIVSMVSLGMGVTVVPQPRHQLLQAYELQEVSLGKQAPFRRISLVWRRTDDGNRKVIEVASAFAEVQNARVITV
ncbi:LysR family transcriptional regulator [Variovorax sp. Root434]|uniref:LysR family transcriptional regulator n=1 Tax=Variovorax sp. Root434 TaxID=1736536 RepID=UPI0006FE3491|nr:LysR family transcriptional regulator [Variovorax sp. Root434]KQX21320.1 LysR family transcriptional regulator [Variovorax sp. Root434]